MLSYIDENYPYLSGTLGLLIRCFVSRDFYVIKKLFTENYQKLEPTMARNISYVIEGLLFDLLAEGQREYLKERLLFIKFCIEKDLFVDKRTGMIPAQPVDNAIYYALWNKDYRWLSVFLDRYRTAFPDVLRGELIRYVNICLLYGEKKYTEALKEIKLIGNVPFIIKWRVRSLELQILFEIKDYDSVYFAIDNYQKFIKNETVSVQLDKMLKANIGAYKTFVKAYSENDSDECNSAVKKLRNEIPSQFGDWILEKISELT